MVFGVDFGASVTDAVALKHDVHGGAEGPAGSARSNGASGRRAAGNVLAECTLSRPGPASPALLDRVLADLIARLGSDPGEPAEVPVGVTGGRARQLPARHRGRALVQVDEPEAVLRGGLHLAGMRSGMVVSCGSGTAMVLGESDAEFRHVGGTPVGGGTIQAFGRLLFEGSDADTVADLALEGDAAAVDTTLADVLGGALGDLPASATAVSLGRIGAATGPLSEPPRPADLAAGLCTMVAQTIALIALNAALANGSPPLVFVGRVSRYQAITKMIAAVLRVYHYPHQPVFPTGAEKATAIGAALAAAATGYLTRAPR